MSWNVNGLRSLVRRDFQAWLNETNYDVVCLQEAKVAEDMLTALWFENYRAFYSPSERPGYAGVATLVRTDHEASSIRSGIGDKELDKEGRILSLSVSGIRIVNVYAPHSHRKLIRLDTKIAFLEALTRFIQIERSRGVPLVLVGDFNVAHQEADLANPKANRSNAGFLPVERQWVTELLASGFIDAFRKFENSGGHYTWWSMRAGVREKNVGWRLDYAFVQSDLDHAITACSHLTNRTGSDHCPVAVEIDG